MTTEGPAHVADTHEIRRRHPVGRADFNAEQRRFSTKPHRADAQLIGCFKDVLLKFVQFGIGIGIVEFAEKLALRKLVAGRPVATDAHSEYAWAAAPALRLVHRLEDHFAAAVEVAVGFEPGVR